MAKRFMVSMVLLLVIGIVAMGLGCAAPSTPTPTTPTAAPATPGVTPTAVAPAVKSMRIHIAQSYRMDYSTGVYMERFKALIEERSGGKIRVDHYPANQLFSQTDQYHAVGTGAVEMIIDTASVLSTVHNLAWDIFSAWERYFKDYAALLAFWEEPAGGGYIKSLLKKDGVQWLGHPSGQSYLPYIVINNKRPVKKVEDWKGLKMRSVVGKEWQLTPYGANAIPIPNAEVITSLQTGMVDGASSSMSGITSAGWDKVTKYCSVYFVTGMNRTFYPLANLAWWNKLDDATKAMILKTLEESVRWVEETWIPKNDAPVYKAIQDSYTPAGKGFYDMLKDDPKEADRHRVLRSEAGRDRFKETVPAEMFNLAESKYKF